VSEQSVFEQTLFATRDKIAGLGLSGITTGQVIASRFPWVRQLLKTAGVLVCPRPEQIIPATNQSSDRGYGVLVAMASPSNRNLTAGLGDVLLWRQQIVDAFIDKAPLAGVPIYTCRVEPADVFWESGFRDQYDVSALVLRMIERRRA
jgi:hypothetical protein